MVLPTWLKNKTVWIVVAVVVGVLALGIWVQLSAAQSRSERNTALQSEQGHQLDQELAVTQIAVNDTLDASFTFSYPSDWTLQRQQSQESAAYQLSNGVDVLVFSVQRSAAKTEGPATPEGTADVLVVQGVEHRFGKQEGADEPGERIFLETPSTTAGRATTSIEVMVAKTPYILRVYKYNTAKSLFIRNTTAQKQQDMIDIIKTLTYKQS